MYDNPDPEYDEELPQGVGNGNLNWTIEHVGESYGSVGDVRTTFREYDWRGRLVMARLPQAPHLRVEYDKYRAQYYALNCSYSVQLSVVVARTKGAVRGLWDGLVLTAY